MGERAERHPISILALKKDERKLFHTYCICLLIKCLEKKKEIQESKPALFKISKRSW